MHNLLNYKMDLLKTFSDLMASLSQDRVIDLYEEVSINEKLSLINELLETRSEFVFNDGVGPNGANVDHDWSNAVFGVATDFELAENVTLTPGIYHQVTMDKSVNDDKDETWFTLGVKYEF